MIVNNSVDETKKREKSLETIRLMIENGSRNDLYDLTGLSGAFLLDKDDINLLETYVGSSIFEKKIESLAKEHIGGEKVLALNRTSSGILATILALVKKDEYVVHFLAKSPAHPSIVRSSDLIGANYLEFDKLNEFNIPNNTSLVIITGSTMDHEVLDEEIFKKIIDLAHEKDIPVFVDDASGARLRTVVFKQKRAWDLGADIVVTSTDKLMPGPRGGLMSGKANLIDLIKSKAFQFGLEAQSPSVAGMVKGLENFNEDYLLKSLDKKNNLFDFLDNNYENFQKTPTGIMISEEGLENEISKLNIKTDLSKSDLAFLFSTILLNEGILTIPAVSMPGASRTIRFDLSSKDANRLDLAILEDKINKSFKKLLETCQDNIKSKKLILG